MIIFVDGDNSPGRRTTGSAALSPDDKLFVYYCSNNTYYKSSKNRELLQKEAGCHVEFIATDTMNNSADFAIAIDAGISSFTAVEHQIIVLISEDKHFQTIGNYIQTINPDVTVRIEKNIHDAVLRCKFYELRSLNALQSYLEELYGESAGVSFYEYLESLFIEKHYHDMSNFSLFKKIKLLQTCYRGGKMTNSYEWPFLGKKMQRHRNRCRRYRNVCN